MVKALPIILFGLAVLATGCQVKPYAPPPQKADVETVEINLSNFHGRPEATAVVSGRLTSSAAQLVDAEQTREGNIVYVAIMEQTPRGAALLPDLTMSPQYQTSIQLDLLGLTPGTYTVSVNDVLAELEIPSIEATTSNGNIASTNPDTSELTNALIPIEDTPYGRPVATAP